MADRHEAWESSRRDNAASAVIDADRDGDDRGSRIRLQARNVSSSARGRVVMIPRNVLVLEDSMIIAMEAEDIFRSIGSSSIHIASNLQQARELVDGQTVDFALLDVNLGAIMSFDFARVLRERGIPFGFSSGYPDNADFPEDLRQVRLLRKPFGEDTIRQHLSDVFSPSGE